MPGSTPVLGLPYPFMGEAVNSNDFRLLADAIDNALDSIQASVNGLLLQPYAAVRTVLAATAAVNVETPVTFEIHDQDTDNLFNPGVPNRFTVNTPGVYMVTGSRLDVFSFTTITSARWSITRNGSLVYAEKLLYTGLVDGIPETNVSGLLVCNATDFIQLSLLWTGTGGPATITANFDIHFVAELP